MKHSSIIAALLIFSLAGCNLQAQTDSATATFNGWKVIPCKTDTIKGILFWQSRNYDPGHGNVWDTCYWVGKCGPEGIFGSIHFIPGIMKHTILEMKTGSKKWTRKYWQHENCCFFDRHWKKIPGIDVYGMIPIYDNPKKAF